MSNLNIKLYKGYDEGQFLIVFFDEKEEFKEAGLVVKLHSYEDFKTMYQCWYDKNVEHKR